MNIYKHINIYLFTLLQILSLLTYNIRLDRTDTPAEIMYTYYIIYDNDIRYYIHHNMIHISQVPN